MNYSLSRLLDARRGAVRKEADFLLLEEMLQGSAALQKVKLNATSYALLNSGRLKLKYLDNFYATYRIRKNPFFPLFLSMTQREEERLVTKRGERREKIEKIMKEWPREILMLAVYLADVERNRNPKIPVWNKSLFPGSMKKAREMTRYDRSEWQSFIRKYIGMLKAHYKRTALRDTEMLFDYMLLECFPDPDTGKPPTPAALKAAFRASSKRCHPDSGGDKAQFIRVKNAWERLQCQMK